MKSDLNISAGILTISDRCSRKIYRDKGGPAIRKIIEQQDWPVMQYAVVPDDESEIKRVILDWSDRQKIKVILTTGGTGLGPRDVTPEATQGILEKELPGIAEKIRRDGSKRNPMAALSRGLAGTRGESLIINLPGSPEGAIESLQSLIKIIRHALSVMQGEGHELEEKRMGIGSL